MKDYKQYISIEAEPEDVYACLTNPFTIELWSDMPAKMEAKEGTEFEMFEGDIAGKILELEPGRKVVQQWYFGDQEEPSIVTFKIILTKQKFRWSCATPTFPMKPTKKSRKDGKSIFWAGLKNFLKFKPLFLQYPGVKYQLMFNFAHAIQN